MGAKDHGNVTMVRAVRRQSHWHTAQGAMVDFMLTHVLDSHFSGLPHTHSSSKKVKDYF